MRNWPWERIFVALTLICLGLSSLGTGQAQRALYLASFFFGGFYAVRASLASLAKGSLDVDLLMVLAACGAASVGAWAEGATLLFLFSLSNVLQEMAMQRTQKAIESLMQLRPDRVCVKRGQGTVEMAPEDVEVGAVVVLRPGERAALDGEVLTGSGSFDEASLTGESVPVNKEPGDRVFAGTVNCTGWLEVTVTSLAGESTLARVIHTVSQAREQKARSQSVLETFEERYALVVLGTVGLFVAFGPHLTGLDFKANFYRAMTLLTVASPCALMVAVPATLLSAMANAARQGVLFKGGVHLENFWRLRAVAFDKTGTLSQGRPEVAGVYPRPGVSPTELLQVASRAEQPSEHPLAQAIRRAAPEAGAPDSFQSIPGHGVEAHWDGVPTLVGGTRLMRSRGLELPPDLLEEMEREGRSSELLVYRDGFLGWIELRDPARPAVEKHLQELRCAGIDRLVMLTGDKRSVAQALAAEVGLDEVHAELLPEDKLTALRSLLDRHGPTAMVGDGINDAPALSAATTGIAMGAGGTDVAMESADVVLMRDDLASLSYAVRLSRKAWQVVWQNLVFALGVILILVTATLTVGIPLPLGVVGHEGSTLLVILNGLRLLAQLPEPNCPCLPARPALEVAWQS